MKNFTLFILSLILLLSFSKDTFAGPSQIADTQGKVNAVLIRNDADGTTIRIYFETNENDRWGCIANFGYVEITTRSSYVSPMALSLIYDLAMTAKEQNKSFALDSPGGPDACTQASIGWIVP